MRNHHRCCGTLYFHSAHQMFIGTSLVANGVIRVVMVVAISWHLPAIKGDLGGFMVGLGCFCRLWAWFKSFSGSLFW